MNRPHLFARLPILPALLLLTVPFSQAASITWTTATVTSPGDVCLAGSLVGALHVGGLDTAQTLNGVTFGPDPGGSNPIALGTATVAFSFDDSFNNDFWSTSTGPGGNAAYGTALDLGRSSNSLAPSGTVTLGGLVTGRTYQVQLWIVDTRSCCNTRNRTVSAGNTVNTSASTGPNIVLGTFTADAATQVITISSAPATFGPQLNLLQLRELTTVVTTRADEDDGSLGGGAGVSLREAVKYSPSGSLITFDPSLSGQTCTLTHADGDMVIDRTLTIDASALSGGFTVNGNNATRHFLVAFPNFLTLRGLTLTGGNADDGGSILNSGTLTLTNCTLTGNAAASGGGAIFNGGNVTLTRCTLTGNSAIFGGAIAQDTASLTLSHCTISGNSASSTGGAVDTTDSQWLLHSTIIAGNTAPAGPDSITFDSTPTPTGVNFIGNLAGSGFTASASLLTGDPKLSPLGYFGGPVQTMHPLIGSPAIDAGGVANPGGTDARGFPRFVDGDDSTVAQLDIGAVEAGPIYQFSSPTDGALRSLINFTGQPNQPPGIRIRFNIPSGSTITLGGTELAIPATRGLFLDASNLTAPVTISGNNTSRVFNIPATATVAMHSLRIVNGKSADGANEADGASGGGIFNGGRLSLFFCTVATNRTGRGGDGVDSEDRGFGGAGGFGGGIFSNGPLNLTACTLSGNTTGNGGIGGTGGAGGGIYSDGPLNLTACTLSGNTAGNGGNQVTGNTAGNGGSGGGIYSTGPYRLTSCTVAGNQTGSGGTDSDGIEALEGFGGGLRGGDVTLQHCLIAQNTGYFSSPDVMATNRLTTIGANLFSTDAFSFSPASGPAPIINPNPLLAPLGDYGGSTQTIALLPGSPAINAATATASITDQRGFPIVGVPDIGAYEYQGNPDLRRFWNTDWDGDGNAFGLEFALGTNVLRSDPNHPKNLRFSREPNGHFRLEFGHTRTTVLSPATYMVKRSTTLLPGSFTEIYRYTGPTDVSIFSQGTFGDLRADNIIEVIDQNPPPGKAFYRIEAISP